MTEPARTVLVFLASALALQVPFVAQVDEGCAAASLAMVFGYWERPASEEEVRNALFEPQLHGILGSRLAAFARAHDMTAFAYRGDLEQLRESIDKGRPVIVAWRMRRNRYHDVVVVGVDMERRQVLVNDPAEGPLRRVPQQRFEERWAGAGHWALLMVPADP